MAYLLDTDVVIHLRDGEDSVWKRIDAIDPPLSISAITHIELENGVYRDPQWKAERRAALDLILGQVKVIDLTETEIEAYQKILETSRFSKCKVSDRITAATAIVHGLTFITMNGRDFRDVEGLKLIEWDAPSISPLPVIPHP